MVKKQDRAAPALDINNVVAAYSEEQIGRMVGLTKSRLRYWARTDFFKPSFVEEDGRLPTAGSIRSKMLSPCERLRCSVSGNGVPLQHLRKVADNLAHMRDELWSSTSLFVQDKKVLLVNPEFGQPQEIVSGQYVFRIPLSEIIEDTRNDILAFRSRPANTVGHLSRNRGIARNALVVSGTDSCRIGRSSA